MKIFYYFIILLIGLVISSCNEVDENKLPTNVNNEKKINIKMAAAFPSSLIILGETGLKLSKKINEISSGNINIKYFEPGALVPPMEIFDAVSSGGVDAGWASPAFWAGKVPALQFFTTFPFGPDPSEYIAWLRYGGGNEIFKDIYRSHNIHSIHCMATSPEGSGWFREEINSVEDLKGLKMRFFGLGAKVMDKVGVSTQLLAGGDIYPALELGTIDATEFAMPSIDIDLGFYQIAKHNYFPGWHQPASALELLINLDKWNALTETQKAQVEATCSESVVKGLAMAESRQPDALKRLQEKGVTLHRWPDETLEVLRNAWDEVVKEEAAKDEDFARVWASLSTFRESYKIWKDLGFVD